jgi:NAD(P)H dehydrogenase (quinone)
LERVLAKTLAERGMTDDVTLTTRNPQVGDLARLDFRVVAADFADPASLEQAFAGAETLMMISATGPATERIALHRKAIDAAVRAGVPKIVCTSRVTARVEPVPSVIHDDSEAKIKASGMA